MKKTIIEEYDSNGKLIKKTTIEEAWNSAPFERFRDKMRGACLGCEKNGLYNPYSPYNPIAKPTITNVPTTGVIDCLDKSIICTASGATEATFKGE